MSSLGDAIESRLLRPGAHTSNIIQVYVSAIRALRRLDPSGITLEAVSESMRAYLKARPDTVRQIVTSLTDPHSSELLEPSEANEMVQEEADGVSADAEEARGDEAAMLEWTPDPLQADACGGASSRRSADVLSTLVNIYGSKALFVNEFRAMLADKLLAAAGYDADVEVRNLELLKKRFGDSALSSCEVMLTDVSESKRISRLIHTHFGEPLEEGQCLIDATVLSRLCWPTLPHEAFEMTEPVKREMARYEKQFAHVKAPRKLVWKPSHGCVTLDVAFSDRTLKDVTCTPIQATILLRFGEKRRWSLTPLADAMGMPPALLQKKLSLWLNRGFIQEIKSASEPVYEAVLTLGSNGESKQTAEEDEDNGAAAATQAAAQLAEEMRVYEQYVTGMLTNLESLPLGRIHNMLKMFVPATGGERGYDRSENELQRFLDHLVECGKLELSAGQYKIKR